MAACSAANASLSISVMLSCVAAGFGVMVGAPSRNSSRLTRCCLAGRQQTRVPGDHHPVRRNQQRICPPEFPDRRCDLCHLVVRVSARVPDIGQEPIHRPDLDLQMGEVDHDQLPLGAQHGAPFGLRRMDRESRWGRSPALLAGKPRPTATSLNL